MSPAIEYRDVSLTTAGRSILSAVSLALAPGTTSAVLGRSGSGKTTLLRMVNGLVTPTRGAVYVDGQNVATSDVVALRRRIGYVIQETGLFPHLTVERNVTVVPELEGRGRGAGRPGDRARRKDTPLTMPRTAARAEFSALAERLLQTVGLDPAQFARRMPAQLSGGQRQRVGLARALAADPPLLLMDEPFGALDPLTRAEMQEMLLGLLARLAQDGRPKTVLLVTHDLDEALYLASRILLVEQGRLVADLPPAEFLHSSQTELQAYVSAFHRGERARATQDAS